MKKTSAKGNYPMYKKITLLIISSILAIGICGCSKKSNNPTPTKKEPQCTITREFQSKMKCPEMKDIKSSGDNIFITHNGELYEYSYKKYSTTKTNCIKVDTDIKFDKIIKNTLISKDGSYYIYNTGTITQPSKEQINQGRSRYGINQMEIQLYNINNNIFYLATIDHNDPEIYGYIDSNKVYSIIYDWYTKKAHEELIYTFQNGEEIEHITNGYVVTNKAYYVYDIINKKECNKYVDVECEYGLVKQDTRDNCPELIYISDNLIVNNDIIEK